MTAALAARSHSYPSPNSPSTSFHDTASSYAGSSRPSSSSSSGSSYAYQPSSLQASTSALSPASTSPAVTRLHRPLPTPPTTPLQNRASLPPRPLPRPPQLHRAQSTQHFRSTPLPTPPSSSGSDSGFCISPQDTRASPLPTPPPEISSFTQRQEHGHEKLRPEIHLSIPDSTASVTPLSQVSFAAPLSPIAFNIPGPKDLRRRCEDELSRRMESLGFVETPTDENPPRLGMSSSRDAAHERNASVSSTDSCLNSDEERDVVVLVEHESDADEHPQGHPARSASRTTMLALLSGSGSGAAHGETQHQHEINGRTTPGIEIRVDVEVEVAAPQKVSRSKRRYSRKWVRERKGKRWTEEDFSEIISELRKLR